MRARIYSMSIIYNEPPEVNLTFNLQEKCQLMLQQVQTCSSLSLGTGRQTPTKIKLFKVYVEFVGCSLEHISSEHGCRQSRLVGQRLAVSESISHVYTSDLARAVQTAELISCELPGHVEITADARLRERGLGCLEGRPVSELVVAAERAKVKVREYTPSGGESLQAVGSRLSLFLEELMTTVSKMELREPLPLMQGGLLTSPLPPPHWHVLVVSHGGALHAMCEQLRTLPGCQLPLRNAATPNTAITSFLLTLQGCSCHSAHTLTAHNTAHLTN